MRRVLAIGLVVFAWVGLTSCGPKVDPAEEAAKQARRTAAQPQPGDAAIRPVLHFMPGNAQFALAFPSAASLEEELEALTDAVSLVNPVAASMVQSEVVFPLSGALGGTAPDAFESKGIDPASPFALFLAAQGMLGHYGLVFEGTGAEAFAGAVSEAERSLPFRLMADSGEAHQFAGTAGAILQDMIAREADPAAIAYGRGAYPGKDWDGPALLVKMGRALDDLPWEDLGGLRDLRALLDYVRGFSDEAVLRWRTGAAPEVLLGIHHAEGLGGGASAPLALHRVLPADGLLLLNVRTNAGVIAFVEAAAKAFMPGTDDKARQMVTNILNTALGDEVALSLAAMESNRPRLAGAFHIRDMQSMGVYLALIGAGGDPLTVHQGAKVYYLGENALLKTNLDHYVAYDETRVYLAPNEPTLLAMIDRATQEDGAAPASPLSDAVAQAPHGAVVLSETLLNDQALLGKLLPGGAVLPRPDEPLRIVLGFDAVGDWITASLSGKTVTPGPGNDAPPAIPVPEPELTAKPGGAPETGEETLPEGEPASAAEPEAGAE